MGVQEKLLSIQQNLKAPKNQYNSFGNYKYRSCEDILEALKPFLLNEKCILTISDEMVNQGNRYYIKATVSLIDIETSETISTTGYARESETKKGMDESQITGTASSYARKYTLNGMFCIDDTKDADSMNNKEETTKNVSPTKKPDEVICPDCKGPVSASKGSSGKTLKPNEVLEQLGCCSKCYRKREKAS